MPAGVPPHKAVESDPGVEERVAMCEAAVAGDERLGVSRADVDRDGPAYTVELLRALRAAAPGGRALRSSSAATWRTRLPTWREPEAVLALARLAVAEREGVGARGRSRSGSPACAARGERVGFFDDAADRHLQLADPRGASPRACRSATSCPDAVARLHRARAGLYATAPAAILEGTA